MDFRSFLNIEADSLLTRLNTVKPFSLTIPMVAAASVSDHALKGMTDLLLQSNRELKSRVHHFRLRLRNDKALIAKDAQAHFAILKLRFNALLDSLDIFADVLTQRVEHDTGVWVAGLDVLAKDALKLKGHYYEAPPLVCFLERGHGAAIRKARTRLPGGELNPVAIIQVPRERMVSSGIASSLIHEVGHQGAALLNLVTTLRQQLKRNFTNAAEKQYWELYLRWISEIVADFWAMGHLGIGATIGLINVVSLPKYFMFRIKLDDPHPFPWIRVMLSIQFGKKLYPHPQWDRLKKLWLEMYDLNELDPKDKSIIDGLLKIMPAFVDQLVNHRNPSMRNETFASIMPYAARQPVMLQGLYQQWQQTPELMGQAAPTLLFAVIGQAHSDGSIDARKESDMLTNYLTQWAMLRSEKRSLKQNITSVKQLQEVIN